GVRRVMAFSLNRTRWGLRPLATGGNLIGASESGVNVHRIKIGNFILCSTLGALAGMLEATRLTSIQPLQGGTSIMFYAVAAAVIGGAALFWRSGPNNRAGPRRPRPAGVEPRFHPAGVHPP